MNEILLTVMILIFYIMQATGGNNFTLIDFAGKALVCCLAINAATSLIVITISLISDIRQKCKKKGVVEPE